MKRLILLILTAWMCNGCFFIYSNFDFSNETKPLEEMTLSGSGKNRILMIDITGDIMNKEAESLFGFSVSESMVPLLQEQLKKAETQKKIKAVVVRINSPGGAVTASDLLYRQLKQFKEKTGLPIYISMMDVAASGGYYVAMAGDKIYAHPTTVTGSIGVIMLNLSFEGLMKKVGVSSKVIKSGENKDIGSPLKDMTPEEKRLLQGVIDDMYKQFVDVVASGRPKLKRDEIIKLADGRVYTGGQAKEVGLVDDIVYLPEVIELVKRDLNLSKARVITYKRPGRYMNNIYSNLQAPLPENFSLLDPALTKPLKHLASPGFYYMWDPAVY